MTERHASEMVERVARAMAENAGFCWNHCAQSQWMSDARAGIEAMRKPTDAMVDSCGNGECGKWAPGAWANMIEAALGDGENRKCPIYPGCQLENCTKCWEHS